MIEELGKKKWSDVVEDCATKLRDGVHLKFCDLRQRFVEELTEVKAKKYS